MGAFVQKYVLNCEVCQCYKLATHPWAILKPHKVPARSWEHVGVDLITQLPPSCGFNMICVYVNYYSDQTHLVLCKSTLTAGEIATLHYKNIFHLHRIPKKTFSNHGP